MKTQELHLQKKIGPETFYLDRLKFREDGKTKTQGGRENGHPFGGPFPDLGSFLRNMHQLGVFEEVF